MDEIVIIDKPAGMTSFGVVARLRRVLSKEAGKKVKVGHTGTLDPFATGLMILLTGKRCRDAGDFSKLDKWYEAEITLGKRSSTGDPEGEIFEVSDRHPEKEEVEMSINKFIGEITQTPPMFSAIKINGRRAYDLARKGETIEMPSRQMTIYQIDLISYDYPILKIRAHVSSGTYIRSLAEDIGNTLEVGAYCSNLRRIRVGKYDITEAKTLGDFGILS